MQRILTIVRTNLSSIISAIDGTVIMTPDLQVGKHHNQEKENHWCYSAICVNRRGFIPCCSSGLLTT